MDPVGKLERVFPPPMTEWPERTAFLMLAGSVSLVLVSIAASEILLAAAIVAALWLWLRGGRVLSPWPFSWPLLVFCLWTVVTIFVSSDQRFAALEMKKFFLYAILPLVPMIMRARGAVTRTYWAIFAVIPFSAWEGLRQFTSDPHRDWMHRISGFMSQWMTYSGLLMLTLVALAALILSSGWKKYKWAIPLCLLVVAPLYLSETRNAWAGAVAGILAMLLLLGRMRTVAGLLALVLATYILSPSDIKHRFRAGFDLQDPNTANRVELFTTAVRLIRDNPWLGVGPKNVGKEALRYRGSSEWPDWMYQHMHNDFLQIAAERGIPGMLIWLWLMGRLAWDAGRVFRRARGDALLPPNGGNEALMVSTAALGAWVAMLVAGMFEYNFGDSEVLILFLFLMSAPYCYWGTFAQGGRRCDARPTPNLDSARLRPAVPPEE